jgi:hypothetical protein
VNWSHFRALLWLRWRLFINQQRRAGSANVVILAIIAVLLLATAALAAFSLFAVGLMVLGNASPVDVLYVWDGLVAAFLLFWLIGLMTELQRAEALSLDKFLQFPVSLSSAFVINYLASLVRASTIFFLPMMVGLALGLVFSRGPMMLLLFPLLAGFVLTVSALTYQFQGWLAALMSNPRRRRTVIVITTMIVILLAQLPNLVNIITSRNRGGQNAVTARQNEKGVRVPDKESGGDDERIAGTVQLINAVVPPGWFPYGAMGLAEGNVIPALLGTLGLVLIGAASLWRAYRTTLRIYTGQTGGERPRPAPITPAPAAKPVSSAPPRFLERRVPWVSEQAAVIALAGFRGLVRAPEAKMMLLSPVILLLVFGSSVLARPGGPSEAARPFIAIGAIAMVLLCMGQLIGNQFGFDRAGFRVFVLCSARRGDILLGKNLSFAPLALGMIAVALVLFEAVYPMRFDLFLACIPQAVGMYLLYCLVANLVSILAPLPIAAGSLRPTNTRMGPVLTHLAFNLALPLVLSPALVPIAVELLLDAVGWRMGLPVALVLSLAVCAAVMAVYRLALNWQGGLLQSREQRILETVTSKLE